MCFFHPESHGGGVCVLRTRVGLGGSAVVVDDLMAGILFYPKFP